MADTKISALTSASALGGTEVLPGVQGGATVGITATQLKTFVTATLPGLGANTFTALQTITQASANAGILASTGYSLTGSDATNMVDLAGTWNTSGTPTAIKLNITNTTSNAASKLIDLQIGGTTRFSVTRAGVLTLLGGSGTAFTIKEGGSSTLQFDEGSTQHAGIGFGIVRVNSTGAFGWTSNADVTLSPDTRLYRDAADIVAQRRSTNAQTLRVYGTYTDASNYERIAVSKAGGVAMETAGTGADDIDLPLTPAGAGLLKFGSHSAITAETVTGYITIKDAAGNSRKLAVVS